MARPPEPTVVSELSSLSTELPLAVSRLYRRLRAERADDRLGDTAVSVLSHLARCGPLTSGQLAQYERVTPPSMNQTVNALELAGLVVRGSDPGDRRRVLITATVAGAELAAESGRRWHAWLDDRLGELTPAQQDTVLEAARLLRSIADS